MHKRTDGNDVDTSDTVNPAINVIRVARDCWLSAVKYICKLYSFVSYNLLLCGFFKCIFVIGFYKCWIAKSKAQIRTYYTVNTSNRILYWLKKIITKLKGKNHITIYKKNNF